MPSAQRWANNQCCEPPPPPPIIAFPYQLRETAIDGYFDHAVWDVGYLWFQVLHTADSLVYMTTYVLEMKVV